MMEQDIPWQLLEKHFANNTEELENKLVKQWINGSSDNMLIYEQLQQYYRTTSSLPIEFFPDTQVALKKTSQRISQKSRRIPMIGFCGKVAAVFVIGFFGWWLINKQMVHQPASISSIIKADSMVTTVILPDSSHIWLNAHSSIKYPTKFGNTREVILEGEAYFEIAHDPKHPFVVHTAKTQTRVLGTKFDIRSYPYEKQIRVTVAEGKVGFGTLPNQQVLLTHNQKVIFDKLSGNIIKKENDNANFMAWKTLEFHFDNQPLEVVFQTLAEAYRFNYQFTTSGLKKRVLTASFKHRPIDEILQTISLSADLNVSIKNHVYEITPI